MKLFRFCGALAVALSMTGLAHAGLLGMSKSGCGAEKGCGCAPTCQPACCKPVIVKPCCPNVYTYQRKCSDIKPPCCDQCAPASCCAPAARHCGPAAAPACAAPAACAPAAAPACAAPAACGPAAAPACAAPAACGPAAAPACAAPAACAPRCAPVQTACAPNCCNHKKSGGLLNALFGNKGNKGCNTCAPTCGAPAPTCAAPSQPTRCCNADPCEIARLIYESQTACYAKDRRKAIDKLGRKYDCICNPEIMTAFIVALNDCDERVRKEAADEIGDQIRKYCCCCPEVVAALTCALGDCDKGVVKQAKEALELCGYEVVDGCCNPCGAAPTCGAPACGPNGCAPAAAPAPMNGSAPAPAPVPPEGQARKSNLSQLLGLLD